MQPANLTVGPAASFTLPTARVPACWAVQALTNAQEAAFRTLLRELRVDADASWSREVARLVANDPRARCLTPERREEIFRAHTCALRVCTGRGTTPWHPAPAPCSRP